MQITLQSIFGVVCVAKPWSVDDVAFLLRDTHPDSLMPHIPQRAIAVPEENGNYTNLHFDPTSD